MAGDSIVEVLIAIAIISLVLVTAYTVSNRSTAHIQDTQEHLQALSLANAQLEFLRVHNGLDTGAGEQCFDSAGNQAVNDHGACSYDSNGNSECSLDTAAYCYVINITSTAGVAGTDDPNVAVTYHVNITWPSLLGSDNQTTMAYRLAQANPAYNPSAGGGGGGGGGPVGGGGGSIPDPDASIGAVPCDVLGSCGVPGGSSYHYSTAFQVITSVADSQVKSCTWNFGDDSVSPITYDVGSGKCQNGQTVSHNYQNASQMIGLDPWPAACYIPLGQAKGAYTFSVTLVIHTVSGTDVNTAQPYHTTKPACWQP